MTVWQFLTEHRVKFLGSATVLVAFLLGAIALGQFDATPTSPALLEPVTVRWMSLILGAINVLLGGGTVAVGFSNTGKVRVEEAKATVATAMENALNTTPPKQGGFIRLPVLALLWVLPLFILAACAQSPIKVAETTGQKAYAAYGTLVISEERIAKLTAPESTLPDNVKVSLISLAERAGPIADAGVATFERYEQTKADFEAQRVGEPALTIVVNNLSSWYEQATALLNQITAAAAGARP